MIDLATRDDFDADAAPVYAKRDRAAYVGMAATMALFLTIFGTAWDTHGLEFWRSLAMAAVIAFWVGLGLAYLGLLADRHERKQTLWRRLQQVLDADPAIVPPAPATATHRLPCGVLLSLRRACGGVLYVCDQELLFQPHFGPRRFWHLKRRVAPEPLHIGPPRTITLSVGVLPPPPLLVRPIAEPRRQVLVCRWEGSGAAFFVPRTDIVVRRLQTCVDALRATRAAV